MLRAYRAAAAALPDAVVVLERNTQRVQWFNAATSDLLGLHYPEDTQAPLGERLPQLREIGQEGGVGKLEIRGGPRQPGIGEQRPDLR